VQGDTEEVQLAKGVGAPSVMVHELGITRMSGRAFCGQVRWATFGAVTTENSQPHVVRCKSFLYGAHNGNVTNCDDLKAWLDVEGHAVLSDNDGEMVVHTVEHFFARELEASPDKDAAARRRCMRAALVTAATKLEGSFAAVIVDPVTRVMWAVKQGSSLYFGVGSDRVGGKFAIASSDLSSVLLLTRVVVPITEGEMVEYDPSGYQLYAIEPHAVKTAEGVRRYAAGEPIEREPVRSRLRAKDTALVPPFESFMDQEISAQKQTARDVIRLFLGGTEAARALGADTGLAELGAPLDALRDQYDDERIRSLFHALCDQPVFRARLAAVPDAVKRATELCSGEAGFFADLLPMARSADDRLAVRLLDAMVEADEAESYAQAVQRFCDMCLDAIARRGRIYVVCCGSSFHAAKAAALFFNELAGVELTPILPGSSAGSPPVAADGDLVVAVSQSGETKDLIDVLNDVIASGRDIARIALVNNVNSTLAQEKSDVVIPLRCGPRSPSPRPRASSTRWWSSTAWPWSSRRRGEGLADARRRARRGPGGAARAPASLPELIRDHRSTDADSRSPRAALPAAEHAHPAGHAHLRGRQGGRAQDPRGRAEPHRGLRGLRVQARAQHHPRLQHRARPARGRRHAEAPGPRLQALTTGALAAGLDAESLSRPGGDDSVLSPTPRALLLDLAERQLFERTVDRGRSIASSTPTTRSSTSPAPTSATWPSPCRRSTPTRSAGRAPSSSPRSTRPCAAPRPRPPSTTPATVGVRHACRAPTTR
jgi:D-arabinose 5-phosphate isomerase GutQ